MRRGKLFPLLLGLAALTGCATANKQARIVEAPPPQAPTLDPLPIGCLRSSLPTFIAANTPATEDATDLLISKVESVYAEGLSEYRADNLPEAKRKFDAALNLLLASNQDLSGDDRLNSEFEKLVEDIHSLEVAALERGDTLSEHRYEPAPIESFAGLTFPVDPNVKQRVQEEIQSVRSDLPLVSNDYVDGVIGYLQTRGRKYVETVLERLGTYGPMITEELKKAGLPQDLIYLAAGESAFNPFALNSRSGAKGMWQFMLGRGIEYGLTKNRWVDEREDPLKSTQAAAKHLKDLYQTFGDWYLAMAAYDSGPLTVQRAIEKTGYADYWTLRKLHALPSETENYVPVFLATAIIAKDPRAYGFDVKPDPALNVDQVVVSVPTDLRLIAQLIDHPVEELIRLNPRLLRWTTPPNDSDFVLNLPPGTKESYEQAIASILPGNRVWWRAHKVQEGETLATVAKKYHISKVALAEANQLSLGSTLDSGTTLVLPLSPGRESSLVRVRERGPRRLMYYRVRPGDSLELIADRFDVTPYQIRRWNHLRSSKLVVGRSLKVYVLGGGARRSRVHRTAHHTKSSKSYSAKRKFPPHNPPVAKAGNETAESRW